MFFVMNTGVKLEAAIVKGRAEEINSERKSVKANINTGIDSLESFIKEEKEIKKLMSLYADLIEKDMRDIEDMVDATLLLDKMKRISFTNSGGGVGRFWFCDFCKIFMNLSLFVFGIVL